MGCTSEELRGGCTMSIIRVPYQPKRYKGALDKLVAVHLLDKYFKPGHRILDPMAGSKTVEKEAEKIGIYCMSNDLLNEDGTPNPKGWDVRNRWPLEDNEVNGVIMHPPYYKAKKYSENERDLGNIESIEEYVITLTRMMKEAKRVTLPGGCIIMIIGDYRKSHRMRMIHAEIYMYATQVHIHNPVIGDIGLELENYDLWELSATGTPFISTKHMMMLNWCMAFRVPQPKLEAFL